MSETTVADKREWWVTDGAEESPSSVTVLADRGDGSVKVIGRGYGAAHLTKDVGRGLHAALGEALAWLEGGA